MFSSAVSSRGEAIGIKRRIRYTIIVTVTNSQYIALISTRRVPTVFAAVLMKIVTVSVRLVALGLM